ncbi:ubiquitin carboxyl-terminal hydrolase 32 isoform X2 [Scaptodrosophila lebanonensis]|uniref:Ubiquitin carboxyl-terminal hydrolase 32 n=1 Tax=Drosophila lebanonensis TaxID=7225 RepID=A0A6J2T8U3_DROLE|nr:ubiquitin carboxyl-terminal hydrolase 32 isoform X2 [Scaptodrosophila lebanonensis]
MGTKESKHACISYEDAVKRVSEAELRRLKDAFKKSAGVGRLYLSRNAFQQDVLCEGVPPKVTDMLYAACGGTQRGISFKDLLCGLVLITRGTPEEKTKFLWNLYCNDAGTYIIRSDYVRNVNLPQIETVSLFAQSERVSFDQFQDWISKHRNATMLSKWLLADNCVSLTSELETPTFYQSLAGVTHLEEKDIGDLEKEFWRLKNTSQNGQIDFQFLGPLISPPIPKNALAGLFNAFDENRDGHIDFKELCCGVSAACRGPGVERTRFCFKIFDVDRDGMLSHEETLQMINVLLFVAKENRDAHQYKELTKQHVINDLLEFAQRKSMDAAVAGGSSNSSVAVNCSITRDNVSLTAEDFMLWNVQGGLRLMQPFLDLIFELCHIVFGLWPQCKHMENDIVRGWLRREERRQYRVGQFWYLISRDWWLNWMQYTQHTSHTCEYCKRSASQRNSQAVTNAIDEALVCDESFNTHSLDSTTTTAAHDNYSLGSASSGISAGRHCGQIRPGPIDNSNLITANPYKNVRTLTGEGGHLKRDTPLVQSHDFELVPKSLWKALNRWYGDNLPLPRQVIQPPNSEVELELYPLNLRILLHQVQPTQSVGSGGAIGGTQLNSWGSVTGSYGVIASGGGYAAIAASSVLQPPKRYLAYTAAFSRLATVRQVGEFLCDQLRLKSEDIRLWHVPPQGLALDSNATLLEEDSMNLSELLIRDNDQLLLEIRNKDLTWPEELGSLSLANGQSYTGAAGERRLTRSSIMSVHAPGATGLHNLGNTCFMNAALQVLFNTQPLAQYFHRNMHHFELNSDNKLGTRGQLAMRYAELLKEVWTATTRSVAPLKLRFCVNKHAPQFAGGGQHDTQELLEWFLDALHEDLNRVMEKPYSELKDSNGRPDKIVAAEAWAQHHARNQSIIIDLFYGQLKSKVSCQGCGLESVRFDPFSLLSLPLPVENYVYFEVLVILLDGSVPIKYGLRLNSDCKYNDLKHKLATLCYLQPNFMLVCELWNSQIRQILPDEEKLHTQGAKNLYVYQLPEQSNARTRSNSTISMHIEQGLKDIQRSSALITAQDSFSSLSTLQTQTNKTSYSSSNREGRALCNGHVSTGGDHNDNHSPIDGDAEALAGGDGVVHRFSSGNSSNNNNNSSHEMLHDDAGKVSRCFGKRECMPHSLFCFKESVILSCSPENNFMQGTVTQQKWVSSTKLLHTESNTSSTSYTNHSGENSMESSLTEPMPVDLATASEGPTRRHGSDDYSASYRITHAKTGGNSISNEDTGPGEEDEEEQHITTSQPESTSINQTSSGVYSRRSSQPYKVGKYLVAVHRKITRHDSYFLSYHKTRPSLFGVPLLIPNCDGGTHKDLYCAVWLQVSRLLSPLPATTEQANHAADCDDSLGYDFPFTLRAVKADGLTCAICPWSKFCRGCEIRCNNEFVMQGALPPISAITSNTATLSMNAKCPSLPNLEVKRPPEYTTSLSYTPTTKYFEDFTIAIDWDPTALHLRYQSTLERLWVDHETVAICRREQVEPVDLNHCLRAFTSEEKLEQWYHCSHCKGKKPATKKLQIWKLPPILIVHLKRFNCVNGKWVKSQKVVHFPFDDFDPTPYLASVPQETILRHKELLEMQIDAEQHAALTANNTVNEVDETDSGSKLDIDKLPIQSKEPEPVAATTNTILRQTKSNNAAKRQRLISTSLTKTPIVDGEFEDYHQHKLKADVDEFDPKYKLYAVVSHSGMLNGGHYISYASNATGSWYCYNDSSCREISQQPVIDPSAAYLLFYERKGLDYEPYLPNTEGRVLPNAANLQLDVDETEGELKKLCTLS